MLGQLFRAYSVHSHDNIVVKLMSFKDYIFFTFRNKLNVVIYIKCNHNRPYIKCILKHMFILTEYVNRLNEKFLCLRQL